MDNPSICDGVIREIKDSKLVVMDNNSTSETFLLDKETEFLQVIFSKEEQKPISEMKIEKGDVREGDIVSVFYKNEGGKKKSAAVKKIVNKKSLMEKASEMQMDYIEIVALLSNIKPLFYEIVQDGKIDEIKDFFEERRLICDFSKERCEDLGKDGLIDRNKESFLFVSKDRRKIKNFKKTYLGSSDREKNAEIGILLGYPKCCADNFIKETIERYSDYDLEDRSKYHYFRMSSLSKTFSPLANPLFCFYGRVDKSSREKIEILNENIIKNTSLSTPYLYLTSHVPCSFDCKETIEYARKVYFAIKEENESVAEELLETLSKPVLFFSVFEFVVFEGEGSRNELYYEKIAKPHSLVDDEIIKKIEKGNRLTVSDDKIGIYRDGVKVDTIKKKSKEDGFLIPFSNKVI